MYRYILFLEMGLFMLFTIAKCFVLIAMSKQNFNKQRSMDCFFVVCKIYETSRYGYVETTIYNFSKIFSIN